VKKKPLTNVQKLREIMEFSNYGALAQMFIIDAIYKVADTVSKTDPNNYDREKWCFISPEDWVGVANEIKQKLDEHLKNERES
jgi:hypothetical protein